MHGVLNHQTTSIDETDAVALVLVGPPAAGKSTIANIFSDYGAETGTLEESHELGDIISTDWQETVDDVLADAGDEQPRLACIEGPIAAEQVDYIRNAADSTLVVLVETASSVERFVTRELGNRNCDRSTVSLETMSNLYARALHREAAEEPYPQHDVRLVNDDELRSSDLVDRCANICCALTTTDRDAVVTPDTDYLPADA